MRYALVLLILSLLSGQILAEDDKKAVTFGGFLDTYYGFDFNEPQRDRNFTTQALRHNEFSINLAYLDAQVKKKRVRGRLALQAGTSVYANYATERRYNPPGTSQLADVMQHIQEAYGGYELTDGLWLDAGIYFAPYGPESFISKDNWTYTRSLAADFSHYYQAGVRLSYQVNPQWLTTLHLINGWQNIIETNSDKAVGMSVAYTPNDDISVTYNNFIGREQQFRFFNDFILKVKLSKRWSIAFASDVGFQKRSDANDYSTWYAETLLAQLRISETLALGGRVEYYNDKDQVIVVTQTPNGFQTAGGSINIDWQPDTNFLFRTEIRSLFSKDAVFAANNGPRTSSTLLVSSVALSF